ncbi:hypothetical protein CBM2588_A120119 [Cupriavidus taiwanensis]|nr:hypothetical protein CBM2588_A120119 [Cupriavidus taiwanensis]
MTICCIWIIFQIEGRKKCGGPGGDGQWLIRTATNLYKSVREISGQCPSLFPCLRGRPPCLRHGTHSNCADPGVAR